MPEFLSAGVFIQEVPSGESTITPVSTSTFATVGWTQRGPENKALLVGSLAEFLRKFGGFWKNSDAILAMTAFFKEGGARAYFVRVVPADAEKAEAVLPDDTFNLEAASSGSWGNTVRVVLAGDPNSFNMETFSFDKFLVQVQEESEDGESDFTVTENFGPVSLTDTDAADFISLVMNDENTGSELVQISEGTTVGIPSAFDPTLVSGEVLAQGDGSPELTISGVVGDFPVAPFSMKINVAGEELAADDGSGSLQFSGAAGYTSVTGKISYLTGEYSLTFIGSPAAGVDIQADYFKSGAETVSVDLAGGADGTGPVDRSVVSSPALEANNEGLFALNTVEESLNIGLPDFFGNLAVDADLLSYCQNRGDCFAILTTPRGLDGQAAINYKRAQLASLSSYGAMYWPHINVADPSLGGKSRAMSPVGHIAGIYARTDTNRNVAKAPAGTIDGAISFSTGLEKRPTQAERDLVYPGNLNPLIDTTATGRAVWGSRTLQVSGDFTQVQWRRLFIFLEKSVFNSTQDFVFEPIGDGLFGQVKFRLEGFLGLLTGQNFFATSDPATAFRVISDSSNNTPQTIAQRILITDILVAVQNPAEFVLFRFRRSLSPLG